MKKPILFILCLALPLVVSLACLQSAVSSQQLAISDQGATVSGQQSAVSQAEPTLTKTPTAGPAPQICAVVVALEALHLRAQANEKAVIVTWLKSGDVVRVVDRSDGDWWFVERNDDLLSKSSGYARSIYLKESECE